MLSRIIQRIIGRESTWAGRHYPAADTDAVVSPASKPDLGTSVTKIIWSYQATTLSAFGRLAVTEAGNATPLIDIDITSPGPGSIQAAVMGDGAKGKAIEIRLYAVSGATGKLTCEGVYEAGN